MATSPFDYREAFARILHLQTFNFNVKCGMRITVLRLAVIIPAVLVIMLSNGLLQAAQLTPLRVGISEAVNTALAIWMAEAAGLYEAEGLKVEIINMQGGSRGAQELQAGRLDTMHVGLSSVLGINRAGGDLRIVASLSNEIRFTFFAHPAVMSAADLKGGIVGVSTFGSESDATVTLALKKLGLTRDDVILKEYGSGTRRIEAVSSGEIKATTVNEPVSSIAREQGLNAMVDLAADRIPWLFSGIVFRRSYVADHRDVVTRFIKATMEGNVLALSNEPMAKQVLARQTKVTDPNIIEISYRDFRLQTPANIEPSREAAQNVIANDPRSQGAKVDDYLEMKILEELKKAGFVDTLQRKYSR
jgi:ABC-type nitrate/sulfonate/bicarbonate transport system substrate-binding protein